MNHEPIECDKEEYDKEDFVLDELTDDIEGE